MPRHVGIASEKSQRPFDQCLNGIGDSMGNAQKVLETFPATLRE
jgi:hypothetical protein